MGIGADPSALRRFAPIFVEAVERWRKRAKDLSEGREPQDDGKGGQGRLPNQMPPVGPATHGKPGQPFIKI
jgi:hypothetical protein